MRRQSSIETVELVGGRLCLDFVNTVAWGGSVREMDRLRSYEDLLVWGGRVSTLTPTQSARLRRRAGHESERAGAVLVRARALRECTRHLLLAWRDGVQPGKTDLEAFNAVLVAGPRRDRVTWSRGDIVWESAQVGSDLEAPLWPIAWSTADLLTTAQRDRLGCCAADDCGWLFWDTSRNRRRRWCSMRDCGNRAKARRHYTRHRLGASELG